MLFLLFVVINQATSTTTQLQQAGRITMSGTTKLTILSLILASLAGSAGCRKEPAPAPPLPAPAAPSAAPADDPAPAAKTSAAAKIDAALASLSADDRALATKQKICPVSGEDLGGMGAPLKVSVAGQEVFVCCESCKEPLLADPAKHLVKIGLAPQEAPPLK